MAGQFDEVPLPIEGFRFVVHAIEYDGDERNRLAGFPAVAQRLSEQEPAQSLAMSPGVDSQPCENRDRQNAARQMLGDVERKITEINLAARQRVKAGNFARRVDQHASRRKVLEMVLI